MKFFGTILLLFFFEFAMGQIPGTPNLLRKSPLPSVHTLSYEWEDLQHAYINAHVINSGQYPVSVSGILWGTSIPTIDSYTFKSTDGGTGGPFSIRAGPLPISNVETIYAVAYATTSDGKTQYGNVLTLPRTVVSPYTGKIWMLYNLGASNLPRYPSPNPDYDSYGYLYQWGRGNDGHSWIMNNVDFSSTTGKDIFHPSYDYSGADYEKFRATGTVNWLSPDRDDLWQGTNGLNNPCPSGFRVPSSAEFFAETKNFSAQNITGAYNSFLKLPAVGWRNNFGSINGSGAYANHDAGKYWTSTIASGGGQIASFSVSLNITGTSLSTSQNRERAYGMAVRCIKGETSSGGTAIISGYSLGSASGTMTASVPVSEVKQTISATVTQTGTYNIAALANNVTFSASGTFTQTGVQNIELTASGTPELGTAPGTFINYNLNTLIPSFTFTRTVQGWSTNGTAEVSSYTLKSSTGIMYTANAVSGVTQTFTAIVVSPGSYNLSTAVINGVKYTASGTFTNTGAQDIVLTASGTPSASGTFTFASNTTPSANFTVTAVNTSTNGTANITLVHGSTLIGTMFAGVPIEPGTVYQRIMVNANFAGNYNISTTVNGVTFSGIGSITSPGNNQYFNLFASGTPIYGGSYVFNTNTSSPTITFTNTIDAEVSSNGSAIISSPRLGGSTGTIIHPNPVSGVSQTIIVNVTKIGTYKISAVANGITYAASGTFTQTGNDQNIELIASGTPLTTGTFNNFTINTTPNVTFSRTINSETSNGFAIFTSYTPKSSTGTLYLGVAENGANTQTITANATKAATYNISTNTANGITFSSSGSFANTGPTDIVLTASGTPLASDVTSEFTINTIPSITFNRTTGVAPEPSSNGTAIISAFNGNGQPYVNWTSGEFIPDNGVTFNQHSINVTKAGTYNISSSANGVTFYGFGTLAVGNNQLLSLRGTGTPTVAGSFIYNLNISGPTGNKSTTRNYGGHISTNGNSHISSYNSSSNPVGTMTRGIPASLSGVTQTINATVTRLGSYNITTSATNGVTFAGSGTFTNLGAQDILLTATGAPTTLGVNTFNLNHTPTRSFTRTVDAQTATANGTAVVSEYNSIGSAGTMIAGVPVSGVTQTFTANVTTPGFYNIATNTPNGVTFSGIGKFDNIGIQEFTLTGTGTPIAISASDLYTLNTTPSGSFNRAVLLNPTSNGSAVIQSFNSSTPTGTMNQGSPVSGVSQSININVSKTGTISMSATRNGVTFAVTKNVTSTGNQPIVLTATGTPTEVESSGDFITNTTPSFTFTRPSLGRPSTNGTAVVSTYTNSTSTGSMFRGIPVSGVTQNVIANVTTPGTYNINMTNNGVTFASSGTFTGTGNQTITFIASGTPSATAAATIFAPSPQLTAPVSFTRATTDLSSNGTAIISGYTLGASEGTMKVGVLVSGVTQTIAVTLSSTAIRSYNISAIANGVTFSASGNTDTGDVGRTFNITLNATGTPTAAGTINYNTNTTPVMTFSRTIDP